MSYIEAHKDLIIDRFIENWAKIDKKTGLPQFRRKDKCMKHSIQNLHEFDRIDKKPSHSTALAWLKQAKYATQALEITEQRLELLDDLEYSELQKLMNDRTVSNAKASAEISNKFNNLRRSTAPELYGIKGTAVNINNTTQTLTISESTDNIKNLLNIE